MSYTPIKELYVTNPCQVLLSFYYLVTNENLNHQYSLIGKYHLV